MKALHKYELADRLGIHYNTLKKWLEEYRSELQQLGYKPNQKILTPKQLSFLKSVLGDWDN